jgi:hypothetical protein
MSFNLFLLWEERKIIPDGHSKSGRIQADEHTYDFQAGMKAYAGFPGLSNSRNDKTTDLVA